MVVLLFVVVFFWYFSVVVVDCICRNLRRDLGWNFGQALRTLLVSKLFSYEILGLGGVIFIYGRATPSRGGFTGGLPGRQADSFWLRLFELLVSTCPAIPRILGLELRACLALLHAESKGHPLPADPLTSPFSEPERFQALECLARLHWEGMTRPTILRTLILLANLIDEYRNAWRPTPNDNIHHNPIYKVSIPPTF